MYVSARLLAINCLKARSFIVRGIRIVLQKLHIYKTCAKDLYIKVSRSPGDDRGVVLLYPRHNI